MILAIDGPQRELLVCADTQARHHSASPDAEGGAAGRSAPLVVCGVQTAPMQWYGAILFRPTAGAGRCTIAGQASAAAAIGAKIASLLIALSVSP